MKEDVKELGLVRDGLQDRVKGLSEDRSDAYQQVKQLQWEKDQEVKRVVKETQRISERADRDRQDYLTQIDKLKTELKDRFQNEIAGK